MRSGSRVQIAGLLYGRQGTNKRPRGCGFYARPQCSRHHPATNRPAVPPSASGTSRTARTQPVWTGPGDGRRAGVSAVLRAERRGLAVIASKDSGLLEDTASETTTFSPDQKSAARNRDEDSGRKTRAHEPRTAVSEERRRLKTPGRWPRNQDERSGDQKNGRPRKTGPREAKKTAVQARCALGKLKTRPSKEDGDREG